MRTRKILHVITALHAGGAESMLWKLLARMDQDRFSPEVISMIALGPMAENIARLGIPVRSLNMRAGHTAPGALVRLRRLIGAIRPDVIQTWMYHADLLGALAAVGVRASLIWNIRHSNLDPTLNKPSTLRVVKVCARLSSYCPELIVCCSEASLSAHRRAGYAAAKMLVIPNGFDLSALAGKEEGLALRRELKIPAGAVVAGILARLDPLKDYPTFICAAQLVLKTHPATHFIACGHGVDSRAGELMQLIRSGGGADRFHLLGHREDTARIYAALDITVSASSGEGFPNVIGESMAAGVPCVVTDAGDSGAIVADTGVTVPSRNPEALAAGIRNMIAIGPAGRQKLGEKARRRVATHFEIGTVVRRYEQLYASVASANGRLAAAAGVGHA